MSQSARPSLILLPGLACDAELFAGQLPALRECAEVQVSDAHARFATVAEMAQALLDEHPGRHVLVGCSMGGMLAFEMQRRAPERVPAMALLGTTARPDTPAMVALRQQACTLYANCRMDEVLRANVLFAFHRDNSRRELIRAYLAMLERAGAAQLIRQNQAVMARVDSRPFLPQVLCPVLIAVGDGDGLTTTEHAQEMAALLPRAELHIVPRAGHMLTMEQPEAVAALLRDWLGRVGDA